MFLFLNKNNQEGEEMQHIMSINNPQVKDWRKLQTRKERTKRNCYLIEGFHLIEEAINYQKLTINKVMVREDLIESTEFHFISQHIEDDQIVVITKQIADGISTTETNQGIFAEMEIVAAKLPKGATGPFLLLDAVQDPGNVGTMIRTADAAGFQGVVLGKGTVDLYNDKTLRAAQGSHFHLEIVQGDLTAIIPALQEENFTILGTALNEKAKPYKELAIDSSFALIVGNEGAGVSEDILEMADYNVYIPMKGQTESLNVAIASSILMFYYN